MPSTEEIMTALTGVPEAFTLRQCLLPGSALSRENANIILEQEVKQAVTQKS